MGELGQHGLKKYDGAFSDLLFAYKKNIFNNALMANKADDVCIVLDYYLENKTKLSITAGPMEVAQLEEQYMAFKPVDAPPVFIYADVDVGDMKTPKFSVVYLEKFLLRAINEGEKLALELTKHVGGKNE